MYAYTVSILALRIGTRQPIKSKTDRSPLHKIFPNKPPSALGQSLLFGSLLKRNPAKK